MIKKIKLTTVEDYLDRNLLRNKVVIGADVSVHSTGLALVRTTEDYLIIERTDKLVTPKKILAEDSIVLFTEQLDSYKQEIVRKYKVDTLIIEDCFFGMNVKVLKALARHSGLVLDRFSRVIDDRRFIYPKASRKLVGMQPGKLKAHQLKKFIVEYINDCFNLTLKQKDNDIADSLVLALGGLIKE